VKKSAQQSVQVVKLGKRATIESAKALSGEILKKLKDAQVLCFDLEHVETADLSAVQLLYAAKREADKSGKDIRFSEQISDAFLETLITGGFLSDSALNRKSGEELAVSLIDF
jgi:anti-anti-sigma regulatory factor